MIKDRREVIRALGGIQAVADLTSRKYNTAAQWNRPRWPRFPPNTFHVMCLALQERGLSAPPSLWGMSYPDNDREIEGPNAYR